MSPSQLRAFGLLTLFPLVVVGTSCEQIGDIKDTVTGLTNPMVVEAIYLGVLPPDAGVLDLSKSEFVDGESVTVYVADAASVADIDSSPVTGADVALVSDGNGGRFPLEEVSDGKYTAKGRDGLVYSAEDVAIAIDLDGDDATHRISVQAPPPADAGIAETHVQGEALTVDISGQGYDSLLIVVIEPASGEISWTNRPETIQELYDLTRSSDVDDLIVEIPGSAFPDAALYAVGVAGLDAAAVDDMEDVNTGLSTLLAGEWRFYPVSTR
ncbi:MAG: hypothetical protein H6742_05215 [Alphaproteobacteria bacterium]|nr:hypothetical protein [Alphaproteobacteria bacterium]